MDANLEEGFWSSIISITNVYEQCCSYSGMPIVLDTIAASKLPLKRFASFLLRLGLYVFFY